MSITHIVALSSKDGAIGKDNKMPWHIPGDLKHFKEYTMGKEVYIGYNTYLSILPYCKEDSFLEGRNVTVVCSTVEKTKERNEQKPKNFTNVFFDTIDNVRYTISESKEEVVIAGGSKLYSEFPPDKIVATLVDYKVEYADAFYSIDLKSNEFTSTSEESFIDVRSSIAYCICTYHKVKNTEVDLMYLKYENSLGYSLQNKIIHRLLSYNEVILDVLNEYPDDVAIAGGAIRSVASNSPIKDVDFYVTDYDVAQELKQFLEGYDIVTVCSTDNAITMITSKGQTLQIITKIFLDRTNPTSILDNFDFTITKAVYFKDTLYLHKCFLEHIASKTLVVGTDLEYPISTLVRSLKYQEYGYSASSMLMVNIALQIHSLNINTYADLKDQLQGIDTQIFDAYFDDKNMSLKFSISDFLKEVSDNYFEYLGK